MFSSSTDALAVQLYFCLYFQKVPGGKKKKKSLWGNNITKQSQSEYILELYDSFTNIFDTVLGKKLLILSDATKYFKMQIIKSAWEFPYPRLLPTELWAQVGADFGMWPSPPQPMGMVVRTSKSALHLQTQYARAKLSIQEATMVLLPADLTAAATKLQ